MVVNGTQLPASFVQFVQAVRDNPLRQYWQLVEPMDACGNLLEANLDIYTDEETITRETAELARHYDPAVLHQGGSPPGVQETLDR